MDNDGSIIKIFILQEKVTIGLMLTLVSILE